MDRVEEGDNDKDDELTDAEKAVWNCVAKHPPEENPLTEIVLGFMFRLSRIEFWQNTQVIVAQKSNIFNIVTGHRTDKNCLFFIQLKYTKVYTLIQYIYQNISIPHK